MNTRYKKSFLLFKNLFEDGHGECPDLLAGGDDLLWGQQESMLAFVSEFHANGEFDAGFTKGPVDGAPTRRVKDAGNAASLVLFAVHSSQSFRSNHRHTQHVFIILVQLSRVAPGKQDHLAVAVDAVVEDQLVLLRGDEVSDISVLNLGPCCWSVVHVAAFVMGGAALVPMEAIVSVGIHALASKQRIGIRSGFSPHSVVFSGEGISIR